MSHKKFILSALTLLLVSGCASTYHIDSMQVESTLQDAPAAQNSILIRYQDKAWLLDSWQTNNDSLSGIIHRISWNAVDTIRSTERQPSPRKLTVVPNDKPLMEDQMILYLWNGKNLPLDSLPHSINLPFRNVDRAAISQLDPTKTAVAIVGGTVASLFLLSIAFIILIVSVPQGP